MTMFPRVGEKRRIDDIAIEDEEAIGSLCRLGGRPVSPKSAMEQEKRIRREIANSNERRRMQSINAGFASLKTLLPHHEGEKLSKAAILQQTAEYIYQLEQEKTRLLSQNCQLKRLLNQQQHHADAEGSPTGGESPCDDGSSGGDPVVVSTPVDNGAATEELRREMIDLRVQLDRERRHRMGLEEQIRSLEAQTYPERVKEIPIIKSEPHESKAETVTVSAQAPGNVIGTVVGQVAGQVTSVVEVSTTPRSVGTVKAEPPAPGTQQAQQPQQQQQQPIQQAHHHSHSHHHHIHTMQQSTATATTATATSTPPTPSAITTTTTTSHPTVRQPAAAVINRQTVSHSPQTQLPTTVVSATPATTIVTVVPSSKGGVESLPGSVFEALTASGRFGAKVEVEPAPRVPSPEATIEYVEDKNHTVYIVNSTNAACQKSLDTICEAIRHLEGDHMFQTEEQHPRIEEEIITEETLTIEDHTGEQVTFGGTQVPVTIGGQVTLGEQVTLGSGQVTLTTEDEPITLHMVGEPQEVPLELTTTHRPSHASGVSNINRVPQQSTISLTTSSRLGQSTSGTSSSHSPNARLQQKSPSHTTTFEAVPVCSISTTTSSLTSHSSSLLQASRPGVIVVKHP